MILFRIFQLSVRDQSTLLEESWNELFVLTAAQWSFPVDEGKSLVTSLRSASLFINHFSAILLSNSTVSTSRQLSLEEDARKLKEIITRLHSLRVDHTEHACLKALVLFKAGESLRIRS